MLDVIEKLLILQNRDRKIIQVEDQLAHIGPEREEFTTKSARAQAALDAAKTAVKQIETERKKLELEVDGKKQQIEKYALQQFQTKKNEEYRALAHEIETCKAAIVKLDDQQLELMEEAEQAQKRVAAASQAAAETKKLVEGKVKDLADREQNLKIELEELRTNREELAAVVDDAARSRYQRLLKNKGQNVVVGIQHGVCGGCHMKLNRQIIVSCQAEQEILNCPNCGRILYYTPDMDMAVAE